MLDTTFLLQCDTEYLTLESFRPIHSDLFRGGEEEKWHFRRPKKNSTLQQESQTKYHFYGISFDPKLGGKLKWNGSVTRAECLPLTQKVSTFSFPQCMFAFSMNAVFSLSNCVIGS